MNLKEKTVLVTGSSRGIGAALVRALLEAGVKKVYATARSTESLDDIVERDPRRVIPLQLDVTDAQSVAHLPQQANDVEILINNAGILAFGSILDIDEATLRAQFETNFYGALNVAKVLLPPMVSAGAGAIVNVLTLLSFASMPGMAAYNASKAATWSMTQSLRASLQNTNVQVHAVFPGAVDTEMLAEVPIDKTSPDAVAGAILSGIEAGAEDIFPDPMSTAVYASWKSDHKAVERQFASM